ncbi:MAG: sigma-70 family RNA polymerase sigma factor [Bacteroidota bacterium]
MENSTLSKQICEHRTTLELFARKFTQDIEDSNDLVQETLIKAIRYAEMYKEGTNMKAWLYTIMKNTFINSYRRISKRNSIIDTSEDLSSAQLKSSASSNLGESKFTMEDINKAITRLQPEYAAPFIKYFEGYKYYEIADELNIPIGTVKTRIHLARQILKNTLKMYASEFVKTVAYS